MHFTNPVSQAHVLGEKDSTSCFDLELASELLKAPVE